MEDQNCSSESIGKKKYQYSNYINAALRPADKQELQRISENTGTSVSSMVSDAVNQYLKNLRPSKHSY